MLVSGPTGSGKTFWLKKLIKQRKQICYPPPEEIFYYYGEYQPLFDQLDDVKFIKGLPHAEFPSSNTRKWIIIDDLMTDASQSSKISDLFTKGSHHRNLSVILIVQNFFVRGKEQRNITLNAQYIVLFKNPRDKSLATSIARQMYPNRTRWFQKIFEDATSKPYSYLLIDLKPETSEEIRLLTHIFGEEKYITAYV